MTSGNAAWVTENVDERDDKGRTKLILTCQANDASKTRSLLMAKAPEHDGPRRAALLRSLPRRRTRLREYVAVRRAKPGCPACGPPLSPVREGRLDVWSSA